MPQETSPMRVFLPSTFMVSGPPESPWHESRPPWKIENLKSNNQKTNILVTVFIMRKKARTKTTGTQQDLRKERF